jgi:hypothetical protein
VKLATAFALLLVLASPSALAQSSQPRVETGFLDRTMQIERRTFRYQVYVPAEYTADRAWPVVIHLHGGGPQGTDGIKHTMRIAEQILIDRSRFPVIVVSPQAQPGRRIRVGVSVAGQVCCPGGNRGPRRVGFNIWHRRGGAPRQPLRRRGGSVRRARREHQASADLDLSRRRRRGRTRRSGASSRAGVESGRINGPLHGISWDQSRRQCSKGAIRTGNDEMAAGAAPTSANVQVAVQGC